MNTAEIALIISIVSALIAMLSLGWNIYRDIILKAKVRIDFGIKMIVQYLNPDRPEYIIITATNHGPGAVTLSMVYAKISSWWKWVLRKEKFAVVMHDFLNPKSGQLPHKLEVGEGIDLLFHYNADCLLKEGFTHVGIRDSFGRIHWAKSKNVREAVQRWERDFKAPHR